MRRKFMLFIIAFYTSYSGITQSLETKDGLMPWHFLNRDVSHICIPVDTVNHIDEWFYEIDSIGNKKDSVLWATYYFEKGKCLKILDYRNNQEIIFTYESANNITEIKRKRIKDVWIKESIGGCLYSTLFGKIESEFIIVGFKSLIKRQTCINSLKGCTITHDYKYTGTICVGKEIYLNGKLKQVIKITFH